MVIQKSLYQDKGLHGWISKEELEKAYELYKKNQYGKYLKDVLEGKYID